MRLLVFELGHAGHRLTYIRLILPALLELSNDVVVCTNSEAPKSPEYAAQLAGFSGRITLDASADPLHDSAPLYNARYKIDTLRSLIRTHRPGHVFVPQADGLTQLMAVSHHLGRRILPRDVGSDALLMRGGFAYPLPSPRARLQAALSVLTISRSPWDAIHTIDPIPFSFIQRRGGQLARRTHLMPDPVETPPPLTQIEARRQLQLPEHGRIIGTVGALDERKGVHLLLDAFSRASLDPDDRLLLVGRLSPTLRQIVNTRYADLIRTGRILLLDRYVSDADLAAAISAMDVVCTPYPRHIGSASIVIRAAAARRPVLGATFGWIGYIVRQFQLGQTVDVTDLTAFSTAIPHALRQAPDFVPTPAAQRFVEFHTVDNFRAAWTRNLRNRLGLSQPGDARDWNWVLSGLSPVPLLD